MIVRGTCDWNLIKIETDSGLYGVGEAYWVDWWPELVVHDRPIWENRYLTIQDKPGYGIEINEDVARAHLAPGETWWG
jgi:L-alanine-DL-glutamate epimerase-like enolase superfamily enzyme